MSEKSLALLYCALKKTCYHEMIVGEPFRLRSHVARPVEPDSVSTDVGNYKSCFV